MNLDQPAPAGLLEAYEISGAVNRTANEGPQLIEPVAAQVLTKQAGLPAAVAQASSVVVQLPVTDSPRLLKLTGT